MPKKSKVSFVGFKITVYALLRFASEIQHLSQKNLLKHGAKVLLVSRKTLVFLGHILVFSVSFVFFGERFLNNVHVLLVWVLIFVLLLWNEAGLLLTSICDLLHAEKCAIAFETAKIEKHWKISSPSKMILLECILLQTRANGQIERRHPSTTSKK